MSTTIQDQVAALRKKRMRPAEIAEQLNLTRAQVCRALHRLRHRKKNLAEMKAYGAKRVGTEEYRKYNRDQVRQRYHADPDFRQRRIDATVRCKARKREARP